MQAPVTAAGEYLMMLPQHLEALLAGSDDAGPIDAEWLDKVCWEHALMFGWQAGLPCVPERAFMRP